jgi:hypothetical protein
MKIPNVNRGLARTLALLMGVSGFQFESFAYPLDGYEETGIRRLEYSRLANLGEVEGNRQPPGALLSMDQVRLGLLDRPDMDIPKPDAEFTQAVANLLGEQADRYSLLILDLSNPDAPLYAEHRPNERQNVGSVGKVVSALGLYQALADVYPDSIDERIDVLRDSLVTADAFSQTDHHDIKMFEVDTRELTKRPMQIGDQGSLWEQLDTPGPRGHGVRPPHAQRHGSTTRAPTHPARRPTCR